MTPNHSMQRSLSDEMGAAAYRPAARWQDYARRTYAAGPSVAGLQALAPGLPTGRLCVYACSETKKLALRAKNRKTENAKNRKTEKLKKRNTEN